MSTPPLPACQQSQESEQSLRQWVQEEFADLDLGDVRRTRRLILIMVALCSQPTASIPQACGAWAPTKAAYRFLDNAAVDPEAILEAHCQKSAQRAAAQPVILALQDTTILNYSTHPHTQGMGPIANNASQTVGFFVHSTLCVSAQGDSLGLVRVERWARDPDTFQSQCRERNRRPLSEKESQRWLESCQAADELAQHCPHSLVVSVADREGDIHEVLAHAAQGAEDSGHAHVLVRSNHDRTLAQDDGAKLWKTLSAAPVAGHSEIVVRGRQGAPQRTARLGIRFAKVRLKSPQLKGDQPEVELWAIEVKEEAPPAGVSALHWRLLSSLPVESLASAQEKIAWYAQRWQIEIFHKTLKSGFKIEQRQLHTRERLERVLALDLISAWRIMHLTKAARETPEAPAREWLAEEECYALESYLSRRRGHEVRALSVREAVRAIAQLGGFLARKSDGEPGPITLWRGLLRLYDITACWLLFDSSQSRRPRCG